MFIWLIAGNYGRGEYWVGRKSTLVLATTADGFIETIRNDGRVAVNNLPEARDLFACKWEVELGHGKARGNC